MKLKKENENLQPISQGNSFKGWTVLRTRKIQRRSIDLKNILESTAAATRVNRNTVSKIHRIDDVMNWKNKPVLSVARKEPVIPKNFPAVVRQEVGKIYLESKRLPTLDLIMGKLKQR